MKYNVGDKVRIKSIDWYNENKDSNGNVVFSSKVTHFSWRENVRTVFTKDMSKFCGKVVTIETVWTVNYSIVEGTNIDYFTDEMIEGLVEEETKPNVIEEAKTYWDSIKDAWICPEGYIFKDENGNIINATKIVLEKKKKEYPKTYEECCKILGLIKVDLCFNADYRSFYASKEQWKKLGLMNQFYQLLICRDAYWKIAGEDMGLDGPWEPDWSNQELPKYCIASVEGQIKTAERHIINTILAFPTPEMRDAFYENFKEELEICKKLL